MRQVFELEWKGPNALEKNKSSMSDRLKTGGCTLMTRDDFKMETDPRRNPSTFSQKLGATIVESLLVEPKDRPTARQLFQITGDALDAINRTDGEYWNGLDLQPYSEPTATTSWPVPDDSSSSGTSAATVPPPKVPP